VQNSASNKMTLRNIGIVFSPTLGIPAGIFSELVSHFGPIFDTEPVETKKRNSILYEQGGADALLGLSGRALDTGERLVYAANGSGRLAFRHGGFCRVDTRISTQ
jgi:RalA-binding protein 1